MEELTLMQLEDPSAKAIVFSQFVNMLDLIEHRLRLGDVKCVKLAGSMSMQRRDVSIKSFTDDPAIRVFLISLKAGGVALNLTVASRIFLMDPWWNPAAEQQVRLYPMQLTTDNLIFQRQSIGLIVWVNSNRYKQRGLLSLIPLKNEF